MPRTIAGRLDQVTKRLHAGAGWGSYGDTNELADEQIDCFVTVLDGPGVQRFFEHLGFERLNAFVRRTIDIDYAVIIEHGTDDEWAEIEQRPIRDHTAYLERLKRIQRQCEARAGKSSK